MSEQVYLGIDLGAESGRVMAGVWNGKQIRLEELHRFPTGGTAFADTLRWPILRLWGEIQNGLALAGKRFGNSVASIGADTWGVDFVLLSKRGELLGLPFHYRDSRTNGVMEQAFARVPRADIFASTGLQFMQFNSLYQLLALQRQSPELLEMAETFLTIPDFLNFCLCGSRVCEFTNATTTQCFDPRKRTWAFELLNHFALPLKMFPEIVPPGTRLGSLRESVAELTGLARVDVIAPATHDTGSAVAAVPTQHSGRSNWAYLSSGTWSLMGVEVPEAMLTPRVLELNLTNEGGVDGTYRLLKNIMGLWLIQQCKRAFAEKGTDHGYAELAQLASQAPAFRSLIDPDDHRFLNPRNMLVAIEEFCRETNQPVPASAGEFARCIFESLALKYAVVLEGLEQVTGTRVDAIHVVGGGSQNAMLNQFTASACGRPVSAGPVEATVLGNLLVQVRARGELGSLSEIRSVVRASNELTAYEPMDESAWGEARGRFAPLCNRKP
jgi:rhamnulokinase